MPLKPLVDGKVNIYGNEYDYWGKVTHTDESGIVIVGTLLVPWKEAMYIVEDEDASPPEYEPIRKKMKSRAMKIHLALLFGAMSLGMLIRFLRGAL